MGRPNQHLLAAGTALALCILSFVHVFLFPLYGVVGPPYNARPLIEYEQSLCSANLGRLLVPKVWKRHCPRGGLVTVAQGGRLGNQIWEYASVWALARRTGLEPYVPRCIRNTLDTVFTGLSIPPLGYVAHCPVPGQWDRSWNLTQSNREPRSIVLPRYIALAELVLAWGDDIRHELKFRPKLIAESQVILKDAERRLKNSGGLACTENVTVFVGVHVRRTDYRSYLQRTHRRPLLGTHYFQTAMEHFENKYGNCVAFIIVSDDIKWCESNLFSNRSNMALASPSGERNFAGLDLAILASCNHSIIDYGTFGVWGAILAAGETVLYNISKHSSVRVGELLPNWHIIS